MNNHIIFGVIASEVRIISSEKGRHFLSFRLQDKTKYNGELNQFNNFPILKYGDEEELMKLRESLERGTVVYLSGEGLYNQKHYYNIIANRIEIIKGLSAEIKIIEKSQSYYERFLDEYELDHEDDGKEIKVDKNDLREPGGGSI